ncbi:uncharacterized protein N7469_001602 [Penicillium citrinum]|uniref:Acyl-CoA dehydrogenase n=1 Tax=Penicillium citrinum TaxID=5077 RepID=A0A9W9PET6_PENCI|nr:uncharacterized protein N7469_001602 [Penicillium citrinum]KAJ5243275.1 hypothetical protein N7469_001602 [Penicillium citrinum]
MTSALTSDIPGADPAWHTQNDHPFYKPSHHRLQRFVREYVDTYIAPNVEGWEKAGEIPAEVFKRHASLGFLAVSAFPLPKDYLSGVDLPAGLSMDEWDEFHDAIIIDEMARCGYLGTVWGINGGAAVGGPPLHHYGTAEQKKKYLAPLLRGEQRHCLGVTEPATRTGPPTAKGISVFIVPLNSKGISRRKMENSGVNSSGSTFMELDDVVVPVGNMLGKENQGFEIIMSTFAHERLWVGITALSTIPSRVIRQKFSRMANLLEPTQAYMEHLVYRSVRMPGLEFSPLAAMLKVQAAHHLEKVSRETQQVFGGLGYSRGGQGSRVEQISRDVRVLVVSGGSEEILLDMIAKQQRRLANL